MISTLLLPLFLLGAPADRAAPPARAGGDDPAIEIWLNNDRRFLPGDHAKVQVRTREDGYLLVLHVDPDGHLRVLFPLDPKDDNFVRGGRKYEIRGRGGRESFSADGGKGTGTVYAAVSHDAFRFDDYVLGDHWDYRKLAPDRLPSNPEPEFNDIVRRMVDGSFDYDILSYTVLERVVYADDYSRPYYDSYNGGCAYGCGTSYFGSPYSLSVGLFFGSPHRRFFYDPFYASYDPFYDPFFYDPYYYRPFYYQPVFYRPIRPYYNYPFAGGFYDNRYRVWNQPYAPYRYRPANGVLAGYHNPRYGLGRSVNTVYLPPVVRDRQSPPSNPIRRVGADRPAGGADARPGVDGRREAPAGGGTTARRTPERTRERTPGSGGDRRVDNRLVRPNIDARRAREPEEARSIMPDARDDRSRRDLPVDVTPRRSDDTPRRASERPQDARPAPQIEARPSRRSDDASRDAGRGGDRGSAPVVRSEPRQSPAPPPEARPEPRSSDRGGDPGGYSPPPTRSDGGSRGGWSGGDRGAGGSGGSGGAAPRRR